MCAACTSTCMSRLGKVNSVVRHISTTSKHSWDDQGQDLPHKCRYDLLEVLQYRTNHSYCLLDVTQTKYQLMDVYITDTQQGTDTGTHVHANLTTVLIFGSPILRSVSPVASSLTRVLWIKQSPWYCLNFCNIFNSTSSLFMYSS